MQFKDDIMDLFTQRKHGNQLRDCLDTHLWATRRAPKLKKRAAQTLFTVKEVVRRVLDADIPKRR